MFESLTNSILFKPPPRTPLCKFREDSKNRLVRSVYADTIHIHLVCPWDNDTSITNYTGTENIILFFHGNNEDINLGRSYCQWLADETRMNVLTCDYPGYGFSTGEPSEEGMKSAACAMLDFTLSKLKHQMSEIFILGKSIGSAPAVTLASLPPCVDLGGIILVAPVASAIRCLSASSKLPNFILQAMDSWCLPNIDRIKYVSCPVQFVHGLQDNIVPCSNTHMLLDAMRFPPHTTPLFVEAGHNDIESKFQSLFITTIKKFLSTCAERHQSKSAYDDMQNASVQIIEY